MSRLRRLFISGKIFFITCNIRRTRTALTEAKFALLGAVFDRIRKRRNFLLSGYVFMPDHWHALISPAQSDTLPRLMGALKIAASRDINALRRARGEFWHLRYFDSVPRTVREYLDILTYIHLNPVRAGLVDKPEAWAWSSIHAYGGPGPLRLAVDNLNLPFDETSLL